MSNNDIEVSVNLTKSDVNTNIDVETKQNIITDIVLSSGGGTKDHNKLKNRDIEDQHPISAITGLSAKLNELDITDIDLQNKILSETTRATTKEIKLETAINKEISRATTKEDSLEASIDTEVTRAISAERILTNSVNNLSATVSNNYTSLSDKINTKQPIGDYATNTALNTETTRATQAENALTNSINNLSVTVDSNYSVLSDKIDTKQPIGDYATNTAVNTVSQNLTQEITNRKNADIELQAQITANKTNFVNYRTAENQDIIDNAIKVSIPTKNSQLTNDSGFITSADVPTKVSQLINDSDYQTSTQVMTAIASIPQFKLKIVDSLPETGEKMVLYLVRKEVEPLNIFNEYLWIEETSSFELLGSTDIDLSEYYKKTETNNLLNGKVDKVTGKSLISDTEIERLSGITNYDDTAILNNISGINSSIQGINADLATKQDVISDLSTIREGASLGATSLQTETDPIYTADKPYLALKSELPTIPTNISEFHNDVGYITNTVDDLVNYTDTTALTNLLANKQDTLVNQENIKSVNNQSLLGSGNLDIDTLENVTYAELVELKTNGQLKKGLYYRITDYVTTTNGKTTNSAEPSRSAGHQFDIIIQALGVSDLAEICTACLHEGDTYFANENLSAWQIWYDINNDTTKYKWAVTDGTGKGVIYRLIDEWGNDCAYDFKNIQFYRDKTLSKYSSLKSYLTATDGYYYTFCDIRNSKISDASITSSKCRSNFTDFTTGSNSDGIRRLNNNIFLGESSDYLTINNKLGYDNYNNIFGVATEGCTADRYFRGNVFGTDVYYFNIGANFVENIVGSKIYSLKADNFCRYNTIGNNNSYLTFDNYSEYSTIGSNNDTIYFKNYFTRSKLGNNCYDCTFGCYNRYNNIGSNVVAINFGNEVQNVKIGSNTQNLSIDNGVKGSSSTNLLDLTALPTKTAYQIDIKMDVNGKVLALWQDLGITKGKYKESITATTWNDITPDYYTTTQIDEQIGDISSVLDSLNGEVQ